jgi:hypothetical protein
VREVNRLAAKAGLTKYYDEAGAPRRCQAFAQAGAEVIYAPLVDADTTPAMAATDITTCGLPAWWVI